MREEGAFGNRFVFPDTLFYYELFTFRLRFGDIVPI